MRHAAGEACPVGWDFTESVVNYVNYHRPWLLIYLLGWVPLISYRGSLFRVNFTGCRPVGRQPSLCVRF
jgi:hypothetical protein